MKCSAFIVVGILTLISRINMRSLSKKNLSFSTFYFICATEISSSVELSMKKIYDRRAKNACRKFIDTVKLYFPQK